MTATAIEEPVLIPNRDRFRKLREQRGWSIDEARFQARLRKLRLSRQTIVDLETGNRGCRLATIGWAMRLYDVGVEDFNSMVEEVPDPPKTSPKAVRPAKPRRRGRDATT